MGGGEFSLKEFQQMIFRNGKVRSIMNSTAALLSLWYILSSAPISDEGRPVRVYGRLDYHVQLDVFPVDVPPQQVIDALQQPDALEKLTIEQHAQLVQRLTASLIDRLAALRPMKTGGPEYTDRLWRPLAYQLLEVARETTWTREELGESPERKVAHLAERARDLEAAKRNAARLLDVIEKCHPHGTPPAEGAGNA